jgi:hypothetical protein
MNANEKDFLAELRTAYDTKSLVKIVLKSKEEHLGYILQAPEGKTWHISITSKSQNPITPKVSFEIRDIEKIEILG